MKPKLAIYILLAVFWASLTLLNAMVPPHPKYNEVPSGWQPTRVEMKQNAKQNSDVWKKFDTSGKTAKEVPNNILALMVQFSDKSFISEAQYPDFLPHNNAFFERWMLHLHDFYLDASHGAYEMNYTLHPQVLTLPHPMAYYGADTSEKIDALLPQILPDLMPLCDSQIDFSDYGGLIIFHAGAGQESDIEGSRSEEIWSTFLTRRVLQAHFDPENDDYPGFTTDDGATLTNVVIVPEDQYQDYFPAEGEENASAYLFSIYGVLAHQFGHVLGLPTLFDNDSSNGRSQGIGNWGLMGTGVWNASGYVPAQLSAWCRYFLGWEDAVTIYNDATNLPIDHFLNHLPDTTRLYKIPISSTEYFLIENRQQNPDASVDAYQNLPSYTFKLLPQGEQEYYENYPLLPFFNFMTNRYTGCEWDFFLPGYGQSPTTDGSGLLIWHIDENKIAETFTTNFDMNRINGDARHKGIDLEEADGYQHLDTSIMDDYKYGGPFDSYRTGNNNYFGNGSHEGLIWLPTSESYYGGLPLEIYDISANANQMTFSVAFQWKLDAGFDGASTLPAAAIDFDDDGQDEIFYPMPSGKLAIFDEDQIADGFPLQHQAIPHLYTWDNESLYIPMQASNLARLMRLNRMGSQFVTNASDSKWDSHPVDIGTHVLLPLINVNTNKTSIHVYPKQEGGIIPNSFSLPDTLMANLSYQNGEVFALSQENGYRLFRWNPISGESTSSALEIPADSTVVAIFTAPVTSEQNLIVQCSHSIYMFHINLTLPNKSAKEQLILIPVQGFPFIIPEGSTAPLTVADVDGNGKLDIIVGTATQVYIIDNSGSNISPSSLNLGLTNDGISAGTLALDINGDSRPELMGNFSYNRLAAWDDSYRLKSGFPQSFSGRSRHLPIICKGVDDQQYLWSATDNGLIFRAPLPGYDATEQDRAWITEYANLARTASRGAATTQNQYLSSDTLVKSELYFFPNPLKTIYQDKIQLSIMPTQDTMVELSIFDISGLLIYKEKAMAYAYLRNLDIFSIPAEKLSSGIYIAIVKAGTETHQLRFGVEK